MGYLSVNIDVDIDEIIDAMSKSDRRKLLKELPNQELLEEIKARGLIAQKHIAINQFTLLSNYKKKEYLIEIFDLGRHASDSEIVNAILTHIKQ